MLNDGKEHTIIPLGISRIEDLNLFLFEYFDVDVSRKENTILKEEDENIVRLPLRDYSSLNEMLYNNKLRLNTVTMDEVVIKCLANDKTVIETDTILGNIEAALAISKPAIILLIDSFDNIYCRDGKNYVKLDRQKFLNFLRMYDIKWLRKETTTLPTNKEIDSALDKIINGNNTNQTLVEERYMINNIHHYSMNYTRKGNKE